MSRNKQIIKGNENRNMIFAAALEAIIFFGGVSALLYIAGQFIGTILGWNGI